MDYCLTLKGEQGEKKSTWLETLCGHQDWYCSTQQQQDKDLMIVIGTSLMIELAELEQTTAGREAGRLKALLTDRFAVIASPTERGCRRNHGARSSWPASTQQISCAIPPAIVVSGSSPQAFL